MALLKCIENFDRAGLPSDQANMIVELILSRTESVQMEFYARMPNNTAIQSGEYFQAKVSPGPAPEFDMVLYGWEHKVVHELMAHAEETGTDIRDLLAPCSYERMYLLCCCCTLLSPFVFLPLICCSCAFSLSLANIAPFFPRSPSGDGEGHLHRPP